MISSCSKGVPSPISRESELHQLRQEFQRERFIETLRGCDRRLERHPDCAATQQLRGETLAELHRLDEAINAYKCSINCDRQRPQPYAYLGQLYDRNGDYAQAAHYYETALQLRPQWQALRYNLARSYLHQGNDGQAHHHYRIAIEQNPQDAKAYNDLGTLYERWGRLQQAQTYYQQAIAAEPNRRQTQRNLAALLLKQHRPQEARLVLDQALAQDSDGADLHHLRGWCDRLSDRLDLALAHYLRSLQLDSNQVQVHEDLGKLFDRLQQPAAALICFQRAVELAPQQLDLYGYAAQMALQLEQPTQAVSQLAQAVARMPENATTWLQTLTSTAIAEQSDDLYERAFLARQAVIRTLMQTNSSPQARQQALAHLYRCWGDVRLAYDAVLEAQTYYQLSLIVEADNPEAERGLGATLKRQQRLAKLKQSPAGYPHPQGQFSGPLAWLGNRPQHRYFPLGSPQSPSCDPHVPIPQPAQKAEKPCQGINCPTCLQRIQEQFAPVALRQHHYHCPPMAELPQVEGDRFTVEIAQGRVWTMPQEQWWKVCEAIAVMTADHILLADLCREYPGTLPGCPQAANPNRPHRIFTTTQLPPVERIEGTVAVLTGLSANVYFHWMVDILPRLDILRRSGFPEQEIDWFYVNSVAKPFQRQTLEQLGIPGDRILESDRHPHLQASRLVVPSFASPLGWATPESIEFLRSHFLSPPSTPSNSPKRLYLSRQTARYRNVINEADLIQCLDKQGFTVITLDKYSVQEQAQLFANAEVIVAPHGAALTNLVFCQPKTTVLELFSPNYIRYYYWSICQYLKLNHYYAIGTALPCSALRRILYPDALTEDFWVDVSGVEELISTPKFLSQ